MSSGQRGQQSQGGSKGKGKKKDTQSESFAPQALTRSGTGDPTPKSSTDTLVYMESHRPNPGLNVPSTAKAEIVVSSDSRAGDPMGMNMAQFNEMHGMNPRQVQGPGNQVGRSAPTQGPSLDSMNPRQVQGPSSQVGRSAPTQGPSLNMDEYNQMHKAEQQRSFAEQDTWRAQSSEFPMSRLFTFDEDFSRAVSSGIPNNLDGRKTERATKVTIICPWTIVKKRALIPRGDRQAAILDKDGKSYRSIPGLENFADLEGLVGGEITVVLIFDHTTNLKKKELEQRNTLREQLRNALFEKWTPILREELAFKKKSTLLNDRPRPPTLSFEDGDFQTYDKAIKDAAVARALIAH